MKPPPILLWKKECVDGHAMYTAPSLYGGMVYVAKPSKKTGWCYGRVNGKKVTAIPVESKLAGFRRVESQEFEMEKIFLRNMRLTPSWIGKVKLGKIPEEGCWND